MVQDFFSMERTTGLLLVSPSLIVIFLVVMTATGQGRNLFRPSSADIAAHVLTTRIGLGIGIAGMIAGLLGFTLLTMLIFDKGARVLPILALVLFALTTVFWVIEMSLRMSIGVWAAQQTVGTGSEPEIWTALFRWIAYLGSTYIATGYLALAGYG